MQHSINDAAQNTLRNAFRRRINRSDASEMDGRFVVGFDHLKFRMIEANALAPQTGLAEDDQLLSGRDHLLHVMQIEPATDQRLAQGVGV